ncbi:MAG: ribonuclease P protein component [Candidatus Saccharimonadales bacterium]
MLDGLHRFHGINSLTPTYKRGQTIRSGQMTLRYAPNTRRSTYRVAVVVSKKVNKSAVVRNRIRRRIYEAVRLEAAAIRQPYDLVLTVFNVQIATTDMMVLRKQIADLLRRAAKDSGTNATGHGIVNQKKTREK